MRTLSSQPLRTALFLVVASMVVCGTGCPSETSTQDDFDLDATEDVADTAGAEDTTDGEEVSDAGEVSDCSCEAGRICMEGRCRVPVGGECQSDGDCARGSCEEVGGTKICVESCTDSCPGDDLTCYEGRCLPNDYCADQDGDTYGIGPACAGSDCDDMDPAVFEGATETCNGKDDNCDGRTDELDECECSPGDTRSCYEGDPATEGRGICSSGTQTCDQNYQWGDCMNQTLPGADICDGKDNDCDGGTDENLKCQCTPGDTRSCYTGPQGTEGVGRCSAGTQTCLNDHTWGACNGDVRPVTEQCDGTDNDCDGKTDEDFNLNSDPSNCGSCGNVCNVPNGQAACSGGSCQIGRCNQNYWDIDGKVSNGCEYNCVSTGVEACNGIDDDCNGKTDDGFNVGATCNGTGACGTGTVECLNPQQSVCSTNPNGSDAEDQPETCDGKDNDCDGQTDETFTSLGNTCTSGTGVCERKGVVVCDSSGSTTTCGATPGSPKTEICDGKDNDCDGQTDEVCELADAPWPTYKYNLRRTGHNMSIQGPDTGNQLWSVSIGAAGRMSPVVTSSGAIYVGGGSTLYKVNSQGSVQWTLSLAGPAGRPTLQSDGVVYIGGGSVLYAVEPSGSVRWKFTTSGRVHDSIISSTGDVYVASGAKIYAFRPDGTKKWEFNGASRLYRPAIGQNDKIYTSASAQVVYALNRSGNVDAKFIRQGADTDGGPAIGQSGIVYTPFGSRVFALDQSLSSVRWNVSTGGDIDSSVSIMNTGFQCCNPRDFPHVSPNGNTGLIQYNDSGSLQWRYSMPKDASSNGAPVFDQDGDAFVGDSNGTLYAIDRSGSLKWQMSLSSSDIWAGAIDTDRLYVVTDGTLYAIGK